MSSGMPLLSGIPPTPSGNESSCRKCDKEFSVLFSRSRKCYHCGYAYCHSCTDYQALMPRTGASGYEPMPVCAYCIENLNLTASGKGQLRNTPLSRLKKYVNAYDIKVSGVCEKDDLIDIIIAARTRNGCLPPANEDYYRKHSVPNRTTERPRGIFTRAMDAMAPDRDSRPSHQHQHQHQHQQHPASHPPNYQPRTRTTSHPNYANTTNTTSPSARQPPPRTQPRQYPTPNHTPRPYAHRTPPPSSSPSRPTAGGPTPSTPRPRSASVPRSTPRTSASTSASTSTSPPPVPAPIPTLDELLNMTHAAIRTLSIPTLKTLLFRNHVNVNAGMVVEKGELVAKVLRLVEDERRERAEAKRRAEEEEREAREGVRREREARERERQAREREGQAREREGQAREREKQERERREREMERQRAREWEGGEGEGEREGGEEGEERGEGYGHGHGHEPMEGVEEYGRDSATAAAATEGSESTLESAPASQRPLTPKGQAMASTLERTGLCVICQDEEANIAIVDCGHLAMCRNCSDLIMSSSRECPLCRTRIVTEARLLRIFRS